MSHPLHGRSAGSVPQESWEQGLGLVTPRMRSVRAAGLLGESACTLSLQAWVLLWAQGLLFVPER